MPWIVSVVPWVFCLILGARLWYLSLNGPSPAPTNFDSRFVPIGQSYVPELCGAYASSLDEGAKLLDAGQPVSMAIDTQSKSWESGRLAAFDKILKPEFSKIIPEGTDDKTVTSSDRLALANAWRGTAKGLREGSKP
jgi:hypothetical protein